MDIRHTCDMELEKLRLHASSSRGACKKTDKENLDVEEVCSDWCSQQSEGRGGRDKGKGGSGGDGCGDEVGKAVAAERKRLQDSALTSRRRAIQNLLDGHHTTAAAHVAGVVCVTKEDCNMERVSCFYVSLLLAHVWKVSHFARSH